MRVHARVQPIGARKAWWLLGFRIPFLILLIQLSLVNAAWADPTCPPSETYTLPQGTADPGVWSESITIDLKPCQSVLFMVTVWDNLPTLGGGYLEVQAVGGDGLYVIFSRTAPSNWPVGGSVTTQLPANNAQEGSPLPGTVGPMGLVKTLRVRATQQSPQLGYSIQVQKLSAPGYNTGSDQLSSAPLLTPLTATVKARFHAADGGQYFRIRLAAGGTLSLTGTARRNYYLSAHLYADIFPTPTSTPIRILTKLGICCGSVVSFTSSTYTNTSSQPAEVYLRLTSYGVIEDVDMQVTGTEGPRLTLFLDADNNFDQNSTSDHTNYIPCADLNSGLSVPVDLILSKPAQLLKLIAAYTDAGTIVTPPPYAPQDLIFMLAEVSAFTGYAMNAGAETTDDFALGDATIVGNTWRRDLFCHDYGGFAQPTVTDGFALASFRLPITLNSDRIPAAGWVSATGPVAAPTSENEDADLIPVVLGSPDLELGLLGDGLSAFEEFRGFMVQGGHVRTDPSTKDLFIKQLPRWIIGFATSLGTHTHRIVDAELSTDRIINFNFTNASGDPVPHFDQRALRLVDTQEYKYGYFGWACHINQIPCPPTDPGAPVFAPESPNETGDILIWFESHNDLADPSKGFVSYAYSSVQIDNERRRTIGHEVWHGVHICHRGQCAPLDDSAVPISIMNGAFQDGAPEVDSRSQYNDFDKGQIRIHTRSQQ